MRELVDTLTANYSPKDYQNSDYFQEIQQLKQEWDNFLSEWRKPEIEPVMISCVIKEVREFLQRDAIIITSSGNVQAQMLQELAFYEPHTCITAGGFSTMGYTLPATIGAKLGKPEKQVIGLAGDGEFLMSLEELHTAMQLGLNIVMVVLNNAGWIAITDLQRAVLGEDHNYATEFTDNNGNVYTPNFAEIAKGFGCWGKRISTVSEIQPSLQEAFEQNGPAVLEIMVSRDPKLWDPLLGVGGMFRSPVIWKKNEPSMKMPEKKKICNFLGIGFWKNFLFDTCRELSLVVNI